MVKPVGVIGEMRLENVEMAVEIIIADPNAHTRLFHSIFTECNPAQHAFFRKTTFAVVHEQKAWC